MQSASLNTGMVRTAISCAAALAFCSAPGAWAQEKQRISYKVTAESAKYPQRHTLDVGDGPGHQLSLYEIHRTFPANAPMIKGVRIKEIWTRGYGDYVDNNGASHNYSVYVLENGDRFFTRATTMGQANSAGRRTTSSVGEITGGTGKLVGMRGMFRATGASEGKAGINETQAEIEYWFAK
jgi:hypothetical protein